MEAKLKISFLYMIDKGNKSFKLTDKWSTLVHDIYISFHAPTTFWSELKDKISAILVTSLYSEGIIMFWHYHSDA